MLLITILVFAVLLLALVMVHEWGHLMAAKKAGCRVEEFGFGFPPRLFSIIWHDTRYSLNLLPLGGFVKIEGENMDDPPPAGGPVPSTSFGSKTPGWRIFILSAGVLMNVVFAAFLLSIQAGVGMPMVVTEENKAQLSNVMTYLLEVDENSPAMTAGLRPFDRVVKVNEVISPSLEQFQAAVAAQKGKEITIEVERQGMHEIIAVTPRENPPPDQGALGVSLAATGLERSVWWKAPFVGIQRTAEMLIAIVVQFSALIGRLASGGGVGETLTGPVGIAVYTNEVTQMGLPYILEFGALISLNLALINILPLPALDGGRVLFVILEKIAGRRFPGKVEQITHTVGFALLIMLMIAITFRDVQRFF